MTFITRFAPSPTGPLHLGHAFSALTAYRMAQAEGGTFLLRIEDIDASRARPEWEAQIFDDLHWLGIDWPEPVMRQSERLPAYAEALRELWRAGLLYECTCSRRDIAAAASAPQEGGDPLVGPDGIVYPGTCRPAQPTSSTQPFPENSVLRLNMRWAATHAETSGPLEFHETGAGPTGETGLINTTVDELVETVGDVVLARRDMGTSYHLAVVLDDAAQGITHVVRGADLFGATRIHVVLQRILGLARPIYHHHRLIRDEDGKRLAKRDDARAIALYRSEGLSREEICSMIYT